MQQDKIIELKLPASFQYSAISEMVLKNLQTNDGEIGTGIFGLKNNTSIQVGYTTNPVNGSPTYSVSLNKGNENLGTLSVNNNANDKPIVSVFGKNNETIRATLELLPKLFDDVRLKDLSKAFDAAVKTKINPQTKNKPVL